MRSTVPPRDEALEELQAGGAGGLFEIFARFAAERGDVGFLQFARQIERGGQVAHEGGILAGFLAAQLVIEVQHGQAQIPARGQIAQDMQQAHGVGAAGDRHADALARLKHAITGDRFRDLLKHFRPMFLF